MLIFLLSVGQFVISCVVVQLLDFSQVVWCQFDHLTNFKSKTKFISTKFTHL